MKAFGYVRLSRLDQDTTSPARQREIVAELCRQRDWELLDVFEDLDVSGGKESRRGLDIMLARLADVDAIVTWKLDRLARSLTHLLKLADRFEAAGVLRDEGESGSNGIDARPGLAEALIRLEAGDADALVVYRLDRLARDLVLQETTAQRLSSKARRLVSVTEPDVHGEDPTRVLVRQVLGALAQYERAVIRARMMAGKEAKRSAGGYAGGRPPYGLRAEGGELVPQEREQATIALARRLRRRGASIRAIGLALTDAGHAPKEGGVWHPPQVARLLKA